MAHNTLFLPKFLYVFASRGAYGEGVILIVAENAFEAWTAKVVPTSDGPDKSLRDLGWENEPQSYVEVASHVKPGLIFSGGGDSG